MRLFSMNKTKKLTQGAMLLAIIGAMMLIDRQLSFIFETFIFMAMPIIIIIYSTMYDIKDGALLSFGLLVMAFLFGSLSAYVSVPLAIIVGITTSIVIKKTSNRKLILMVAVIMYVIGEILLAFLIQPLVGLPDIKTQIEELNTLVVKMFNFLPNSNLIFESLPFNKDHFLIVMLLAGIILTGVIEGFFTYFLSITILKRLKIKDITDSKPIVFHLSTGTSYILFILSSLGYLIMNYPSFIEKYEIISYIIIITSTISSFILFYYGYIFVTIYLKLVLRNKSLLIILFLMIIFMFFVLYPVLIIIGFLYGSGPLERVLEKKMAEIKNETTKNN